MLKEHLDRASPPKSKGFFRVTEAGDIESHILDRHRGRFKEGFSPRTIRILDNGKDVHHRLLRRLAELGLVAASEVEIPPNALFRGRADAVVQLPGKEKVLLEIKSVNPATFANDQPLLRHVLQVQLYLHYLGMKEGILLYENKANQELKEFLIQKDIWEIRRVLNRFNRIKEILEDERRPGNAA